MRSKVKTSTTVAAAECVVVDSHLVGQAGQLQRGLGVLGAPDAAELRGVRANRPRRRGWRRPRRVVARSAHPWSRGRSPTNRRKQQVVGHHLGVGGQDLQAAARQRAGHAGEGAAAAAVVDGGGELDRLRPRGCTRPRRRRRGERKLVERRNASAILSGRSRGHVAGGQRVELPLEPARPCVPRASAWRGLAAAPFRSRAADDA